MFDKYLGFNPNFTYFGENKKIFDERIIDYNLRHHKDTPKYIKQEIPTISNVSKNQKKYTTEDYKNSFKNKKILNLKELIESYEIFEAIVNSKKRFSKKEQEDIIYPIINNINLTYNNQIFQIVNDSFIFTNIESIWSNKADDNLNLIELREYLTQENEDIRIKNFFKNIDANYIYDSQDINETGRFESTVTFLKKALDSSLTLKEIDLIISLSDWLYKYSPGDCEFYVKDILLKNRIKYDSFQSSNYKFYIERILSQ